MMVVCLKLSNNWLTCFDSIQSLKYCRLVRRFLTLMNLFFFLFLLETIKRSFLSFRIHSFCLFVVGLNGLTNIEKKVGACFFSFHFCLDKMFFFHLFQLIFFSFLHIRHSLRKLSIFFFFLCFVVVVVQHNQITKYYVGFDHSVQFN